MQSLERLWDVELIKQAKARYLRLFDMKDWDNWGSLLTETCVFRLGVDGGTDMTLQGRDHIVSTWKEQFGNLRSFHHAHGAEIDFSSDVSATGCWAYEYFGELEHGKFVRIYGRYEHELERSPEGRWLFSHLYTNRLYVQEGPSL